MSNQKNIPVHKRFIELLRKQFELNSTQVPTPYHKKSWHAQLAIAINNFIHNDLYQYAPDLYEEVHHKNNGQWPGERTIQRAFIKDKLANPHLIEICGWFLFKEQWPIEKNRFPKPLEPTTQINMESILRSHYLQDDTFIYIRIPGDKDGFWGKLPMDSYYAQLSYIETKELANRNTLIKKEQESLLSRFSNANKDLLYLGADYLSADILEHNQHIIITGQPGVGKSTYARWLCNQWANDKLSIQFYPIFIQLRDLNFGKSDDGVIAHYIQHHYLRSLDTETIKHILTEHLSTYLFILDGYDELNRHKQIQLEREIRQLSRADHTARYIVLSRPYGLIYNKLDKDIVLQIDGFTESSIENYIHAFLSQRGDKQNRKEALLKIIKDNYILKEHAHTPLMLSYIVLIYFKESEPQKYLSAVKSTYDLQAYVFRWLIDYSMGHDQLIDIEKDWQEKAEKLAYTMLMNQDFSYSPDAASFKLTRNLALQFSKLGIGSITDDHDAYTWHFSFNTATLQEFLASTFLLPRITPTAFTYLVQDQSHWNLAKFLLGGLSLKNDNDVITHEIFKLLEQKYNSAPNSFIHYLYFNLLSETHPSFLKKYINDIHLKQLLQFYETSYYDPNWRPIISEAFQRIYHKLPYSGRTSFHELFLNTLDTLKDPANQVKGGATAGYLLLDIIDTTEIKQYQAFAQRCVETLRHLKNQLEIVDQKLTTLYERGNEEEGFFHSTHVLFDREKELEESIIFILEFLSELPKERLEAYKTELLEFRGKCPIAAILAYEEVMVKFQAPEQIIQELQESIQSALSLPSCSEEFETISDFYQLQDTAVSIEDIDEESSLVSIKINWDELDNKEHETNIPSKPGVFPLSLIRLAGAIFKAGKLIAQQENEHLSALALKAANLYLEKIFNTNFIHHDAVQQTSETIIEGLTLINSQASCYLIFDYIYRLKSSLHVDILDENIYSAYIEEKLTQLEQFIDESTFMQLCKALEHSWNGRYSFFKYREQLKDLFFSILKRNQQYYEETDLVEIFEQEEENQSKLLRKILEIPFFAYDRKYFIDQIITYEHPNNFLHFYAIPFLFEMNFPFYQEFYWSYFKNLDQNTEEPLLLLDLLMNKCIFYYSSNLKHVGEVLYRLNTYIEKYKDQDTDEMGMPVDLDSHSILYLYVVSNTLKLLKESEEGQENYQLIECIGNILRLESVKECMQEKNHLESFEASDLITYILNYHFTKDHQNIVSFDYQHLKQNIPQTHKELIIELTNLFPTINEIEHLKPVLGDEFYKDTIAYLNNFSILFSRIDKNKFEKQLSC